MQSGLRNAALLSRSLKRPGTIQQHSRRPISLPSIGEWVSKKLMPEARTQKTPSEVAAEKQKAAQEGKQSLLEQTMLARKTPDSAREPTQVERLEALKPKALPRPLPTSHKYSTANFSISHRKLNLLSRQIAGKPIDYAILQMQFSEKRASKRIKTMLLTAKKHATAYKRLEPSKLVVAESWVTKGPNTMKRLEIRGRGHFGIRTHPDAKMHVVLKEGKTLQEKKAEERARRLRKIVSANYVREDRPLRNTGPMWAW